MQTAMKAKFSVRQLLLYSGAAVAAFFVGLELDHRIRHREPTRDAAMARPEIFEMSSREREVRERIEKVSGVRGAPLFNRDEWAPAEPVSIDGVDVSDLFAGEYVYKRSVENNFSFRGATVEGVFTRPHTFLDIGVSAEDNSRIVYRFSSDGVRVFERSSKGALESLAPPVKELPPGCTKFQIVSSDANQSVVCQGITLVQINLGKRRQRRVFAASNLMRGEIRDLTISQ